MAWDEWTVEEDPRIPQFGTLYSVFDDCGDHVCIPTEDRARAFMLSTAPAMLGLLKEIIAFVDCRGEGEVKHISLLVDLARGVVNVAEGKDANGKPLKGQETQ